MQIPVWMLILISTLSWGLWGVCDKMALRGMHPLHVQLINAITMALIIPVYYLLACSVNRPFVWESKYFLWSIAGAIATSFASVTYIFALNQKDATYVVGLTTGYPVVTFLLAILLLGEKPTLDRWFGLFLVIIGVWLISK